MPIYEYQCGECGHELEAMQKISDPVLTKCPACGAEALKKQISKVAFRLKGTGWYETDFKDKKKEPAKSDGGDLFRRPQDGFGDELQTLLADAGEIGTDVAAFTIQFVAVGAVVHKHLFTVTGVAAARGAGGRNSRVVLLRHSSGTVDGLEI